MARRAAAAAAHRVFVEERAVGVGTGGEERTAVVVHGLLGSGRNWRNVARRVLEAAGGSWRLLLVDQRCHGRSAHLAPPHDLAASARDIRAATGGVAPDLLMGHSLGGKVAAEYLRQARDAGLGAPRHCVVLDAVPWSGADAHAHGTRDTLELVHELAGRGPVASRRELHERVSGRLDAATVDWLGTNLVPVRDNEPSAPLQFVWDVDGCVSLFESYVSTDAWDALEDPPQGSRVDVVRAEHSMRQWEPHEARMQAAKAHAHVLPNAGHWLHVDNPQGLVDLLAPIIKQTVG